MTKELLLKWWPVAVAFVVGAGAGSVATFLYTRKLHREDARLAEDEIVTVNKANTQLRREMKQMAAQQKADIARAFTEHLGYSAADDETDESEAPEDDADDEENYDPDPDEDEHDRLPEVISREEFQESNDIYEKISLTYYAGDDTLVDDDGPIDNVDFVVGFDNLYRFGELSNDPNVVYIRSYRLEVDFEIVNQKRGYVESIIGFEVGDKKKRPLKMRNDSD